MRPRSLSSYVLPAFALAAISLGGVGALGVGMQGCTVLTNDALPDDAGTFEAGGDAGPSTACTSCVTQECTGAWAVCLTDSRCVALRGCNNPFGESQGARDQCFCDNADASAPTADGGADPLAAYAAFASCNDARTCGKCATDCTSACAGGATKTTAGTCGVQDDAGDAGDAATDLDAGDAGDAESPDERGTSRPGGAQRRPMFVVRRGQVWRPEEGVCNRQRMQRVPRVHLWLRRRRVRRRVWKSALDR